MELGRTSRKRALLAGAADAGTGATAGRKNVTTIANAKLQPVIVPRRQDASEKIAQLERSPSFASEVAKASFQIVRLPGSNVEVLLPATGGDAFHEYARRLAKTCSFPDQKKEIEQLAHVAAVASLGLEHDDRPLIGVMISEPKHLLREDSHSADALLEHIERMGCRAVLIPPRADLMMANDKTKRWAGITAMVSKLDGLAGPGGADVHPRIYGQLNRFSLETNYPRDRFEADVAIVALRSDVYMLGICRSHQLWNAATGGSMVQDTVKEGRSSIATNQEKFGIPLEQPFILRAKDGTITHENRVYITKGTELSGAARGQPSIVTNAFHHQAVKRTGDDFHVSGIVRDRKTGVETIEATEAANAITVQWHPEISRHPSSTDRALIDVFGRRAHVFYMLRKLRAAGIEPAPDQLAAAMKARPELGFTAQDYAWVRRQLAVRLAQKAL